MNASKMTFLVALLVSASLAFACGDSEEPTSDSSGTEGTRRSGGGDDDGDDNGGSSSGGSSSGGSSSGGSSSGSSSSGGSSGGGNCSPTGGGCSFSIECCSNSCNQSKGVCL